MGSASLVSSVFVGRSMAQKRPQGHIFPKGSYRHKMGGNKFRFSGGVLRKCADWQWYKAMLNLRGWSGDGVTRKCCWKCNAGLEDPDCFDVSPYAPWRSNPVSIEELAAWAAAFFAIPGTHLSTFKPDWMHTSCLGVLQYLEGNICLELFQQLGGVFSRAGDACAKLEGLMKA